MSEFSFRSITFMLVIAFLVWSSNFDACMGRRGRHWRQSRASFASLSKKKGKSNHGGGHYHSGSGSKPKPPSHKKAPSPPRNKAQPPPHNKAPSPPQHKAPPPPPPQKGPSTYNVLDFGAKGNGGTDDTKAFQAAWAAACKVEASSIIVPAGYQFLVGPISFNGP